MAKITSRDIVAALLAQQYEPRGPWVSAHYGSPRVGVDGLIHTEKLAAHLNATLSAREGKTDD